MSHEHDPDMAREIITDVTRQRRDAMEDVIKVIFSIAFDHSDTSRRGSKEREQAIKNALKGLFYEAVSTPPRRALEQYAPEERAEIVAQALAEQQSVQAQDATGPERLPQQEFLPEPSDPLPQCVGQLSLQFASDQ